MSKHSRQTFELRVERYLPDLVAGLEMLYPGQSVEVAARLVRRARLAFEDRSQELHDLDERRLLRPDWLQRESMVGYAAYADRIADDLEGVGRRADYLRELGVTYLHLMPLLTPREGDSDGGYAVADFRSVREDLGTMKDLDRLTRVLRAQGISLCLDLVLNHVAREHEWAQRARAGEERYRDYFHVFADRSEPDEWERTLPEVFPDFAPGNFTFDDELDAWVWTTFNEFQWDLNWANPRVLVEFARIILELANRGVEIFRLDAIAFTWKRLGTDCQNQPEVHAVTQVLHAVTRIACPAVAFKAEAIVGPRDLVQYLGRGPHAGRVSDIAYHNSLMVQTWSMLACGETRLARHALGALPPKPTTGTWVTYVRCHDDIGWAIDDGDAAAVGVDGFGHRAFLSDWYSGQFEGSDATGLVFQHNPATGDRRISGTSASLLGLTPDAEGQVDPAQRERGLARLRLAYALAAGWGGIPVIWSGDELALPNDEAWASEPGHEDDNRWAHRPCVDKPARRRRKESDSVAGQAFSTLAGIMRVRASLPQLHGSAEPTVITDNVDERLLVLLREHPSGVHVGVYNVSGDTVGLSADVLRACGLQGWREALAGTAVSPDEWGTIFVPPYAAWWLVDAG